MSYPSRPIGQAYRETNEAIEAHQRAGQEANSTFRRQANQILTAEEQRVEQVASEQLETHRQQREAADRQRAAQEKAREDRRRVSDAAHAARMQELDAQDTAFHENLATRQGDFEAQLQRRQEVFDQSMQATYGLNPSHLSHRPQAALHDARIQSTAQYPGYSSAAQPRPSDVLISSLFETPTPPQPQLPSMSVPISYYPAGSNAPYGQLPSSNFGLPNLPDLPSLQDSQPPVSPPGFQMSSPQYAVPASSQSASSDSGLVPLPPLPQPPDLPPVEQGQHNPQGGTSAHANSDEQCVLM